MLTYPNTSIEVLPGDILYSPVGCSTYFVGHSVIIGTDFQIKEVLPGKPAWCSISIERFWTRHFRGDRISLLRSAKGADAAANWATMHLEKFQSYNLLNYNIQNVEKSYCYKFVTQAYFFGANVRVVRNMHRLLLPQDIKKSPRLQKIAVMEV